MNSSSDNQHFENGKRKVLVWDILEHLLYYLSRQVLSNNSMDCPEIQV